MRGNQRTTHGTQGRTDDHGRTETERRHRSEAAPSQVALRLVALAQQGDVLACHDLYDLFTPLLRSALSPYRRDAALYEELQGEVYVMFHFLILQFEPERDVNVFTYLSRTLPPSVWSYVRQQRKRARREVALSNWTTEVLGDATRWEATAEEVLARLSEEERRWLARESQTVEQAVIDRVTWEEAMEALPPRQRAVFHLREREGYCYCEIAQVLGITASSARTHYEKARGSLRARLKKIFLGD